MASNLPSLATRTWAAATLALATLTLAGMPGTALAGSALPSSFPIRVYHSPADDGVDPRPAYPPGCGPLAGEGGTITWNLQNVVFTVLET